MNHLTFPLAVAFLFFLGTTAGWVLEFLFRNLISHSGPKGRYFINPGFCKGPWLPIYGVGIAVLCVLTVLITSNLNPALINTIPAKIIIILLLGLAMNIVEFIGGIILLKGLNMRLWDYRQRPGNFMGIVCPLFALIWTAIAAIYYLFIHEIAIDYLIWFANNLAFAFFVGLFFGIFIIDLVSAFIDASLVKQFADDRDLIVRYEDLKALMQQKLMESNQKQHFFNQIIQRGMELEKSLEACSEAMESKLKSSKRK